MTSDDIAAAAQAATDRLYSDLGAYEARVAELVADRTLTQRIQVWCAECGRPRGRHRPLGSVVDSPDGLLLVVRAYNPIYSMGKRVTVTEARGITGGARIPDRARGWIVDGPNTYAERFAPQRPAFDDDVAAVTCPEHGRLVPAPGSLAKAARSGWIAVGVARNGSVAPL